VGLTKRASFDALAAAVLFVRWSDVIAGEALAVYYALQPRLAEHPYLEPFYPRLFSLIDYACRRWIFFPADLAQRYEAVLSWQGLRQHVWGGRGFAASFAPAVADAASVVTEAVPPSTP
jgi:hypothetical protein